MTPLAARAALLLVFAAGAAGAGTLAVVGSEPPANAGRIAPWNAVTVHFDRAVAPASVTHANFRVWGHWSGPVAGALSLVDAGTAVRFRPSRRFSAGETVFVNLSHDLQAVDGSPLRAAGYAFQFNVDTAPSNRVFSDAQRIPVRTPPGTVTTTYGGQASDLDQDGWRDFLVVNEQTADLRVMMNRDDGSGLFEQVSTPTTPIGAGASPNEPGDFDDDGLPDAAVANAAEGSVSIVLGHGDGTFGAEQVIAIGAGPNGLAVLDIDGDADLDVVVASGGGNKLYRLLNNGAGVFGAATQFEGGGNGEYALASGDLNGDGITDLALGTQFDSQAHVLLGNGDGTFTHFSNRSAGGATWMAAVGDANGDRKLDVVFANGSSSNGGFLAGNGDGTLAAVVTKATSGSAVATDLGDLDGDGDLDWVVSSYGGGRWHVFVNGGTGTFSEDPQIFATNAASCATLFDPDNDHDLDMALVDEVADEVQIRILANDPQLLFADRFEAGDATAWSAVVP